MALSRIGFSSAEATTITIPGTYAVGDLIIIFAFRDGSTTNPTVPGGWTKITNTADGTTCSLSAGWKLATSGAESSGTWTNASGLVCAVYRGQATNKTPIGQFPTASGTTNTVTYPLINGGVKGGSWVVGFAAHRSTDTTIETAPTGLVNQTTTAGATAEYVGHDSNGTFLVNTGWPSTTVAISGTASGWMTLMLEILADVNSLENFKRVSISASNAGIISSGEAMG